MNIAQFSNYKTQYGDSFSNISSELRLQMQILLQLGAQENSPLKHNITESAIQELEQDSSLVELSNLAISEGSVSIAKKELVRLSKTAEIILSETISKKDFQRLQKEAKESVAKTGDNGNTDATLKYECYGKVKVNESLYKLATQVCHTQQVHFFTEGIQYKQGEKLRTDNVSKSKPTILVSVAGIDYLSGVDFEAEKDKSLLKNMWKNAIASAARNGVEAMSIPPVGLGVYLGANHQEEKAKMYFDALVSAMNDLSKQEGFKMPEIYFNPIRFQSEFEQAKKNLEQNNQDKLHLYKHDVKLLATEWAKAGIKGAYVNPSDPSVLFGAVDLGKYHHSGNSDSHYAGEEHIACTSTAVMGSSGITDAYTNPKKIHSIPGVPEAMTTLKENEQQGHQPQQATGEEKKSFFKKAADNLFNKYLKYTLIYMIPKLIGKFVNFIRSKFSESRSDEPDLSRSSRSSSKSNSAIPGLPQSDVPTRSDETDLSRSSRSLSESNPENPKTAQEGSTTIHADQVKRNRGKPSSHSII